MQDNNDLQNLVSPTCCPLYTLPPRGGELNYSITFAPGAFHNESTGNFQPEFDFSILLLENNLTVLETLLLQTTTQTAAVGIRSELIPSRKVEGSERSQTTFPTASFDATVGFNPSLNNAACDSTPLAGSIDIARYNLLREDGKPLCPVAVAQNGANLSLCKVPATFLNSSTPDEFFFTFHEARLKSLCRFVLYSILSLLAFKNIHKLGRYCRPVTFFSYENQEDTSYCHLAFWQ